MQAKNRNRRRRREQCDNCAMYWRHRYNTKSHTRTSFGPQVHGFYRRRIRRTSLITPICPTHKTPMIRRPTKWGPLYICTEVDCDIMKWGDSARTSPADRNTRARRHAAHEIFDRLWKEGHISRDVAYDKLAKHLGLLACETHIGLFGISQCEETIQFANQMQKKILLERFT